MRTSTTFRDAAGAVALALMCAAGAYVPDAHGAPRPSITVRVHDIDLASPEGPTHFLRRLQEAARTVCNDGSPHDRWTAQAREHCYQETLERTVRRLREPRVTATFRAQRRSPVVNAEGDRALAASAR